MEEKVNEGEAEGVDMSNRIIVIDIAIIYFIAKSPLLLRTHCNDILIVILRTFNDNLQ